jgi:hypothetical protein
VCVCSNEISEERERHQVQLLTLNKRLEEAEAEIETRETERCTRRRELQSILEGNQNITEGPAYTSTERSLRRELQSIVQAH